MTCSRCSGSRWGCSICAGPSPCHWAARGAAPRPGSKGPPPGSKRPPSRGCHWASFTGARGHEAMSGGVRVRSGLRSRIEDGSGSGQVRIIVAGGQDLRWRQHLLDWVWSPPLALPVHSHHKVTSPLQGCHWSRAQILGCDWSIVAPPVSRQHCQGHGPGATSESTPTQPSHWSSGHKHWPLIGH